MSIKKLILSIGLCVLFASCSTGKYSADTTPEAKQSGSAVDMGIRYLLGRGVRQDNEKAFYYFSQAANEGDPFAQNEIAYMYAVGKGTERNYEKALRYYQQAAEQGLASAQYNLGLMYMSGLGTTPNKEIAMQWLHKSAAHGFEPARIAISRLQ